MRFLPLLLLAPLMAIDDSKLTVHTLVREDIFAGLLAGDMETHDRGMAKLKELRKTRPAELATIDSWESLGLSLHAANAWKAGKKEEARKLFDQAWELQTKALAAEPKDVGVNAVVGGAGILVGDRLPTEMKDRLWKRSFETYSTLYKLQERQLLKMPVHHRGEVMTGMLVAAQRSGEQAAFDKYFPIALESLKGTAYASLMEKWNSDPSLREKTNIACKTCHDAGKLANMRAAQ
jgi:hypothetical protein